MTMTRHYSAKIAKSASILSQLTEWQHQSLSEGSMLTASEIAARFKISKRQAYRYLQRLNGNEDRGKVRNPESKITDSILEVAPNLIEVLKRDLKRLERIEAASEAETLSLIKQRRDQVAALAKLRSQLLEELRELGLLPERADRNSFGSSAIESLDSQELEEQVARELQQFEEELQKNS